MHHAPPHNTLSSDHNARLKLTKYSASSYALIVLLQLVGSGIELLTELTEELRTDVWRRRRWRRSDTVAFALPFLLLLFLLFVVTVAVVLDNSPVTNEAS